MGIIPALGLVDTQSSTSPDWIQGWSSHSWLLTDLLGETAARLIGMILFAMALTGFLGAALGLLAWGVPHEWWRTLAVVSAVVSLAAVVLYWNALIFFIPHKVGALSVSIATLVCLLWLSWPAEVDIGF
jgi:hypothetical protein